MRDIEYISKQVLYASDVILKASKADNITSGLGCYSLDLTLNKMTFKICDYSYMFER